MKLSAMTTEQATNAICLMAEPIGTIGQDAEFHPMIVAIGDAMQSDKFMATTIGISKAVPFLLKKHKQDTYTIICAMTGKTMEQVAHQNIVTTIKEVKEFFDKDFIELFMSSVGSELNE